jgi:GT2 family glycosyltransferase
MTARLAIGLCTFNRGPAIIPTLDAIGALDDPHGRLASCVIVDNNSTDSTAQTVRDYIAAWDAAHPDRAGFFRLAFEPIQGQGEARRRFVESTTEPLLAFLDDDVLPSRGWALAMLAAMDADPKVGAAGGRVALKFESDPTWWALRHAPALAAQDFGATRTLDNPRDCLVGAAITLRRAALDDSRWLHNRLMGGRAAGGLASGDDHELCIRIRRAGWKILYVGASKADSTVLHCIPARRTTRTYLLRLLRGISEADPWLDWIAAGEPQGDQGLAWLTPRLARAKKKLARTRLLEWRPRRRARRLAEREGRLEGLRKLEARLRAS